MRRNSIEKACPNAVNMRLHILDDGGMTDMRGRIAQRARHFCDFS